jgi:uncharacterized protein (UPF0335 family)
MLKEGVERNEKELKHFCKSVQEVYKNVKKAYTAFSAVYADIKQPHSPT